MKPQTLTEGVRGKVTILQFSTRRWGCMRHSIFPRRGRGDLMGLRSARSKNRGGGGGWGGGGGGGGGGGVDLCGSTRAGAVSKARRGGAGLDGGGSSSLPKDVTRPCKEAVGKCTKKGLRSALETGIRGGKRLR